MPTASRQTRYFGYEIDRALFTEVAETIHKIKEGGSPKALGELAANTLINITDAGFDAYYAKPAELAGISGGVRKAADTGINAVKKGIHMVVRKLLKNRELADLRRLAHNLSYMICVDPDTVESINPKAYACFRLKEELYQRVINNMSRVHEDPDVASYRSDVVRSVEDLIAAGIDVFYTRPVDEANIGKLTRKAADFGIHTVQKGSNAVVHRLFKDMDHDTLLPMAEYFETLLHSKVRSYHRLYMA